jgi:hypothetical protein
MKKLIAASILVVSALAVLFTGTAAAQSPQPPTPVPGIGRDPGRGPQQLSVAGDFQGPLHQYVEAAMAKTLGISGADLKARLGFGQTAYQIAIQLGVSPEEIPALLKKARADAVDAAASANAITQAQADWMKSRPAGDGLGGCGEIGQPQGARIGRGMRLQQRYP